jgi:hypothetical protein
MARWRIPVSPPRETIGFPIGAGIGVVVADLAPKENFGLRAAALSQRPSTAPGFPR